MKMLKMAAVLAVLLSPALWGQGTTVAPKTTVLAKTTLVVGSTPANVTLVNSWNNGYTGCSSVTTCNYSLPNNPTSGNILIVEADGVNGTPSISGTGAGCPSSFTAIGSVTLGIQLNTWRGVAAGTGACQLSVVVGSAATVGIAGVELNGQTGSPIDATGSNSVNGSSSLTVTAGNATTQANDYAVTFYASAASSGSGTASGWTTASFSNAYDGGFVQAVASSGTTPSAAMTGMAATGNIVAYMVVVK